MMRWHSNLDSRCRRSVWAYTTACTFVAAAVLSPGWVVAETAAVPSPALPPLAADELPDLKALGDLARDIMLLAVPHEYENTRRWGRTIEMWDGLHLSLDGLRLKTKRRKKQANHGTWKRYHVWLVEPRENLEVSVTELQRLPTGQLEFVLTLRAPLGAFGRLSEWRYDVQLYSFSMQADALVSLRLRCRMGFALDFRHFPPDLLLDPAVQDAELRLEEFRLRRLSDLSGPLVRELGEEMHDVLQDEIEQRRERTVRDLNRQIDKNRHRMRISIHELVRWEQLQEQALASPPVDGPPAEGE